MNRISRGRGGRSRLKKYGINNEEREEELEDCLKTRERKSLL